MARLVVYVRSSFCPDVWRWQRWVSKHELDYVEIDIDRDDEAYAKVRAWTGHESVPTLVIAPDDGLDPVEEPEPLPDHNPRAVDRGTMLTEPNPGQVEAFLDRWGIPYGPAGGEQEEALAGESRPWWKIL